MSWTGDLTDADAEGKNNGDDVDHNDAGGVEPKGDDSKEIASLLVFALLGDKSTVEVEWVLYDDLTCTIESQVLPRSFTSFSAFFLIRVPELLLMSSQVRKGIAVAWRW